MSVWLTVPCHRPRLEWLRECIASTGIDRNRVVVVTNGEDPIKMHEIGDLAAVLVTDETPGVNISRWWNLGMKQIHRLADGEYEILVANADVLATPQTVEALRQGLRYYGVTAVAPDQAQRLVRGAVRISHDPRDYAFTQHMWGYFYMLAGERQVEADENIRWWLSDNAVEVEAKLNGGFALLGGVQVYHRAATPYEEPWITMGEEDRAKMDARYFDLDLFGIRSAQASA